jgi:hypothetical protein
MFQRAGTEDSEDLSTAPVFLRDKISEFRMTVTSLREDGVGSPRVLHGPGAARIRVAKDVAGTIGWKVMAWNQR